MTDRIDENPPMSIQEQAAEWLLRWHCGDLSIAERFEYLQWLKTSPVHIAETLRMCRLFSWLENTKLKLFITNEDNFSNVVELPPRERERAMARGARRAGLWRVRIAASAATIGLSALFALGAKVVWLDHTLQTQASEWRNMPLSDGSSITAAPYTRLRHEIDDDQRVITLSEGSAMFRVARDESRPFLVHAGIAIVTATGTEFTVERRNDTVIVTMREGAVVVSPAAEASMTFTNVPLAQDDQLTISRAWTQPLVARVNAEQTTEWVDARLTFKEGDTVGTAVARFNDYNRIKISVDGRTGSRPWRGAFDANDPLSFAAAVHQSTGATLVREASERVRIGRRDGQTT